MIVNFRPYKVLFSDGSVVEPAGIDLEIDPTKWECQRAGFTDVELRFDMTPQLWEAIRNAEADSSVELILLTASQMRALKATNRGIGKCRCPVLDGNGRALRHEFYA